MTNIGDSLVRTESPLARLDPRWKFAALVLVCAVTAILQTLPSALLATVMALGFAAVSRLPLSWYLRRIGPALIFLAVFTAPLPFLFHNGLNTALLICAKAFAIVTLTAVLL